MSEGTKGGDVNRPGSRPEIDKLPKAKCERCLLLAATPAIVVNGQCRNERACLRRQSRRLQEKKP